MVCTQMVCLPVAYSTVILLLLLIKRKHSYVYDSLYLGLSFM